MIGAQNARILVKNQCRTKTTTSVFFVSVHVCEKMAIAALYAPMSFEVSCLKLGSVKSPGMYRGVGTARKINEGTTGAW
jgi:hypothetical protein